MKVESARKKIEIVDSLEESEELQLVPIADLPKVEQKINQEQIVPEKYKKELTAQEVWERFSHDCTDLFLYIDKNNVNYLTWNQIYELFKTKNLLSDKILDNSDNP